MICKEFPNLIIIANDKTLLEGYEVDIALPSLNMAIEWNGIVHFKPIYGDATLTKIQQRDAEKQLIAEKNEINLIVITDLASTNQYVNEVFHKIKKIIKQRMLSEP